ncbi:hypothetical protein EUTSA_v10009348mg [Eutrema salsugineum]|uniref:TF-B3 domain-containing protein n=1 Tax=Eutrema salsugineum TaxID=72664 RepID=V4KY96_EUTSA|nr:B3 domain-containing protein At1g05920 [Eutrema salsugineum]ESQ36324.1 hypothetical protein EUTSA_v10009348mg [Eutrema salsugineum]
MRKNQYLQANASSNNQRIPRRRTAEEEEEEEMMRRIFDLVPRRIRSIQKRSKEEPPPDFSKVTRRKRSVYTYTIRPKWILRLKIGMKLDEKPVLLIEKTLDENDVDPSQNRLLIPFKILKRHDFLTADEFKILGDDNIYNEGRMGVAAILVDQRTKQWRVVLKKCVLKTVTGRRRRCLLLSGEWSNVVEANSLRDDDNISLWSFSRDGILFFALDFAGDAVDFSD